MAREQMKPFYSSAEWKTARKMALRRDHYTCQICGARATEVHHKIEINENNVKDRNISLNQNNLQSLCHDCHSRITMQEHRGRVPDSGIEFYFDENGMIQKYPDTPGEA